MNGLLAKVIDAHGGMNRWNFAAMHFVAFWHEADIVERSTDVRFRG
jgi:hypothetical protein